MNEACKILNCDCRARQRRLKIRNEWSPDNLTLGKAGCYMKKINDKEVWITCINCYNTLCNISFIKYVYTGIKDKFKFKNQKHPKYDKMSKESGLLDIRLITKEEYLKLMDEYGYSEKSNNVIRYELYRMISNNTN